MLINSDFFPSQRYFTLLSISNQKKKLLSFYGELMGDLSKDWLNQRNFPVQLTFFAMCLWFGMAQNIYHLKFL